MSGEFDLRKGSQSRKFERRPRIFGYCVMLKWKSTLLSNKLKLRNGSSFCLWYQQTQSLTISLCISSIVTFYVLYQNHIDSNHAFFCFLNNWRRSFLGFNVLLTLMQQLTRTGHDPSAKLKLKHWFHTSY